MTQTQSLVEIAEEPIETDGLDFKEYCYQVVNGLYRLSSETLHELLEEVSEGEHQLSRDAQEWFSNSSNLAYAASKAYVALMETELDKEYRVTAIIFDYNPSLSNNGRVRVKTEVIPYD